MFQKLLFPGLLFISIVVLFSEQVCTQTEEGEIIVISERVGEVIDLEERNRFNLFSGVKDFRSAILFKRLDGSYAFKMTFVADTTGEEKIQGRKVQTKAEEPPIEESLRPKSMGSRNITEFGVGVVGAVLFGVLGAVIGDEFKNRDHDDPPEALIGFAVGSTLGSTAGVWLAGKMCRDNGLLVGAFSGAFVPPCIGLLVATLKEGNDSSWDVWSHAFFGSMFSPLGSTIGYNISRRPSSSETGSLFRIEKDKTLRAGIPSLSFRPILLPEGEVIWEYQITLVTVQF